MKRHTAPRNVTRSTIANAKTPVRFTLGRFSGYGANDAEALADLTVRVLFNDPHLTV